MILLEGLSPALLACLPLAVAAGIDLYLTLVLVALAPLVGFGEGLPDGLLSSLGAEAPLIMAIGFYALEFASERSKPASVFWHLPQVFVRPVAAGLLALLILKGSGVWGGPWLWAVVSAVLAYLAHGFKTGAAVLGWLYDVKAPSGLLLSIAEDVVVVALIALALDAPAWSALFVGAGILLVGILAPNLLPASRLGRYLAWQRSWGSLTPFEWTEEEQLPPRIQSVLASVERPFGKSLKAARCSLIAADRRRALRPGWIVLGGNRPYTLRWRGRRGPLLEALPDESALVLEAESLFLRLRIRNRPLQALIFPRSGPAGDTLEAELSDWKIYRGNPSPTGV